ncbi:MAG TPA: hypothetical protein VH815_11435, partial [Acidobacteriota bacterium]
ILRNKYFKGYRITDQFPDKDAISKAYAKELSGDENETLLNFLCVNWIYAHSALSQKGFGVMDIEFPLEKQWLPRAHEYLHKNGHKEVAKKIVRSLAITYPEPEIHIFISILSDGFADQQVLRKVVQEEIVLTQSNPQVLRDHLRDRVTSLISRRTAVKESIEAIEDRKQNRELDLETQLSAFTEELKTIQIELQATDSKIAAVRKEFEIASEKLKQENTKATTLRQRKERIEGQVTYLAAKSKEDTESDRLKINKLQVDYDAAAEEEKNLNDQITEVETRIRGENERVAVVRGDGTDRDQARESGDQVGEGTPRQIDDLVSATPVEWTAKLADDLYTVLSFSSCVTSELNFLHSTGLIDSRRGNEKPPQGDYLTDCCEWRDYYANRWVKGTRIWDRTDLAWYAWFRTITPGKESRELLLDFIVSGLYHAARSDDQNITELLLGRFLELCSNVPEINTIAGDLPKPAMETIDKFGSNSESLRFFGLFQSKLASANPKGLMRLYDYLPPRTRIIAKRSLVVHLSDFGLNEKEPGHEMLDVICTTIDSNIAPFASSFRSWCKRATLQTILNDRATLLRLAHKSLHTFSVETERRLNLFRQLFGKELSDAMAQNRPETYAALNKRSLEFIEAELRSPEWLSSRYLLP